MLHANNELYIQHPEQHRTPTTKIWQTDKKKQITPRRPRTFLVDFSHWMVEHERYEGASLTPELIKNTKLQKYENTKIHKYTNTETENSYPEPSSPISLRGCSCPKDSKRESHSRADLRRLPSKQFRPETQSSPQWVAPHSQLHRKFLSRQCSTNHCRLVFHRQPLINTNGGHFRHEPFLFTIKQTFAPEYFFSEESNCVHTFFCRAPLFVQKSRPAVAWI